MVHIRNYISVESDTTITEYSKKKKEFPEFGNVYKYFKIHGFVY